jgi:hypothetical protein
MAKKWENRNPMKVCCVASPQMVFWYLVDIPNEYSWQRILQENCQRQRGHRNYRIHDFR